MQQDTMDGDDGPRDLRIVLHIARAYDIAEDQDDRPRHHLPRSEDLDSPSDTDLNVMGELRGLLYELMEDPQQPSDRYRFGYQRPRDLELDEIHVSGNGGASRQQRARLLCSALQDAGHSTPRSEAGRESARRLPGIAWCHY